MKYSQIVKEKLKILQKKEAFYILAIESSCDETAISVTYGREIIANIISSQIDIHKRFGGVVPEIASRNHTLQIDSLVKEALCVAKLTLSDIECVAVTYGAGLLGALLVGVSYAKALAFALNLPLIAVNHIRGHIAASYIQDKTLAPPYICLLASGGHTAVLDVKDYTKIEVLGQTQDDAAGEAFDKVARVAGLPYPGGPEIEKLANGNVGTIMLPRAFKGEKHLNFSFSGIKTAVINYVRNNADRGVEIDTKDLVSSFQREAVAVLVENTLKAVLNKGYQCVSLAGGVGANKMLREKLSFECAKHGIKTILPDIRLCTDNACMIGIEAFIQIKCGNDCAELTLDANPNLAMDCKSAN